MRKLLRGLGRPSTFGPLIACLVALIAVASQSIPANAMALIINGVDIAMCIMIVAVYLPPLLHALRADTLQRDQYLLTGILTLWLALGVSRIWSIAIIVAGKPAWMVNHWFQTFCYLVAAMSGYYFLRVPGMRIIGFRYWTAAAVIAVCITTIMLAVFGV